MTWASDTHFVHFTKRHIADGVCDNTAVEKDSQASRVVIHIAAELVYVTRVYEKALTSPVWENYEGRGT